MTFLSTVQSFCSEMSRLVIGIDLARLVLRCATLCSDTTTVSLQGRGCGISLDCPQTRHKPLLGTLPDKSVSPAPDRASTNRASCIARRVFTAAGTSGAPTGGHSPARAESSEGLPPSFWEIFGRGAGTVYADVRTAAVSLLTQLRLTWFTPRIFTRGCSWAASAPHQACATPSFAELPLKPALRTRCRRELTEPGKCWLNRGGADDEHTCQTPAALTPTIPDPGAHRADQQPGMGTPRPWR